MTEEIQGEALPDAQTADSSTETAGAETPPVVTDKTTADAGAQDSTAVQKRIDKLTWEREELRRQNAHLMERAYGKDPEPPKEEAKPTAPTLAQFEYDEAKYQAAIIEFTRAEARAAALEEIKSERQQQQQQSRIKSFKEREADFISKTPDYQEKVYDPSIPFSTAMVELIAESPDGPALAYHLASNPSLAAQIASLPPMTAARELGKVEARLEKAKEVPPPPVVSKAPAPPPKIDAVEPDVKKTLDDPAITDAEFKRIRERQIAQRR